LWALTALALFGAGVLLLLHRPNSGPAQVTVRPVTFGGPFQLTDVDGKSFSSNELGGRPYAIFFGFTHCPDVCPTTLARLIRLRHQLSQGAKPFEIIFVTVDPERDRPAELKTYLSLFKEPIIGLTGTQPQIDQVKRQFGIYSGKVPDEAGGYTVDHTATVLLFDSKGAFVATISAEEKDAVALAKLKRISAAENAAGD
jgi:protein SCO1/2